MIKGEGREAGKGGGEGIGQATGQREWEKVKDSEHNVVGGEKRKRECAEVERKGGR